MEIFRKFPNYFRSNPFDSISGLLPLLFNSPITFFRSFSKIYPYFIRLWVITPFIRSSMIGSLSFVAEIFLIDVFFELVSKNRSPPRAFFRRQSFTTLFSLVRRACF